MRPADLPLEHLVLDPNNYRLQESTNYVPVQEDRYLNEQIQERTLSLLKGENLGDLIRSIRANGFLPIERIVVTPLAGHQNRYLVIEGNRRVAALKTIQDEAQAGIPISEQLQATLAAVPCIIAEGEHEAFFKEALMGIRHVGGIKQWGGYQRAKLIADLRDIHRLEANEIADRLGLSVAEINRRYRAFKVLQQMQEDEEFGDHATPVYYALFHEAVALPIVREWLGFNQRTNTFDNDEALHNFYELITPRKNEDGGEDKEAKLSSYLDIRNLRPVLVSDEAKACLLDPARSLLDAQTIARRDELSRQWRIEVSEALTALRKVGAIEVEAFTNEEIASINELVEACNSLLRIHQALRAA